MVTRIGAPFVSGSDQNASFYGTRRAVRSDFTNGAAGRFYRDSTLGAATEEKARLRREVEAQEARVHRAREQEQQRAREALALTEAERARRRAAAREGLLLRTEAALTLQSAWLAHVDRRQEALVREARAARALQKPLRAWLLRNSALRASAAAEHEQQHAAALDIQRQARRRQRGKNAARAAARAAAAAKAAAKDAVRAAVAGARALAMAHMLDESSAAAQLLNYEGAMAEEAGRRGREDTAASASVAQAIAAAAAGDAAAAAAAASWRRASCRCRRCGWRAARAAATRRTR